MKNIKLTILSAVMMFGLVGGGLGLTSCNNTEQEGDLPDTGDKPDTGGEDKPDDGDGGDVETPEYPLRDELGENYKTYKFEAECCDISGTNTECTAGCEAIVPDNLLPSGGLYVMKIDSDGSVDLTFDIYADKAGPAVLNLCMGRSDKDVEISKMFVIRINGKQQRSDTVYKTAEETKYFEWQEQDICKFDLVEGKNTIIFSKMQQGSVGLNFDYLNILTESEVSWFDEHEAGGHSYSWTMNPAPSETEAGKAIGYCEYCRDYKEVELPIISEENGYAREVSGSTVTWTYVADEIATKDGPAEFTFTTTLGTKDYKFECETMVLKNIEESSQGPTDVLRYGNEGNNPSGGLVVQGMNNAHASITLTINSSIETTADFILCIGRNSQEYKFNATHTLTVNDEPVEISDDVVIEKNVGPEWVDWATYTIAEINLKAGENVIVLTNNSEHPGDTGSAPSGNMDYFTLKVYDEEAILTQVDPITPVVPEA